MFDKVKSLLRTSNGSPTVPMISIVKSPNGVGDDDSVYGIPRQKYSIPTGESPCPIPRQPVKGSVKAPPPIPISWQYANPHWPPEEPSKQSNTIGTRVRTKSFPLPSPAEGSSSTVSLPSMYRYPDMYKTKRCHSCRFNNPIEGGKTQIRCRNGSCGNLINISYVERVEAKQLVYRLRANYSSRNLPV